MKKSIIFLLFIFEFATAQIPSPPKLTIKGTAGVTYDGYGLTVNPKTPSFYSPRRPWNLVRFNFQPVITYGNFKMPMNFSFSPMRTNFGSAPFGFGGLPGFPKQSVKQWLTNPINSIGFNPTYKWAEVMLGTQYLKYSDLSTGDIGAFGYGFNLKPGKFRISYFEGVSQQAFQTVTGLTKPDGSIVDFPGIYKRKIQMGQLGIGKDDIYFVGFNLVKGLDKFNSITSPLAVPLNLVTTPYAADNFILSFSNHFKTKLGWYGKSEIATTISDRNTQAFPPSALFPDYLPFKKTNVSSFRDHALQATFGKKIKNYDLGASIKWLGAGYNTMGYPFVQNDRLDYTLNSKFSVFKNTTNVVASLGQRFGNWSVPGSRTKQILANINVFSQINEKLSLNSSYNNFGFQTPGFLGIKNIGNDLNISPNYIWTNTKMSNLLNLSYNWSKYVETIPGPSSTTNNTHTAMLLYAPTFFDKPNLSPDFSVMYFTNKSSIPSTLKLITATSGLGLSLPKQKINLKGQLMYTNTSINTFTPSNSILASLGVDYKISKRLRWNTNMTGTFFKFGDELTPPPTLLGAHYLESTLRTSLQYKFGKE
ncbi:hypothetical protein EGI22_17610 [Lacihabitans sp. LS3-19]|uniref:hypothetical protein n=1 Tax=Lacihabitans sp. LS3-19 TaxID=2487335 RepID=UPI0020CD8A53|nr:hypothetical protein [Lacihabitans sp. LS3-19]MCP9769724.1 hypothetical protein [Lacihabitans sp. LS3-19]